MESRRPVGIDSSQKFVCVAVAVIEISQPPKFRNPRNSLFQEHFIVRLHVRCLARVRMVLHALLCQEIVPRLKAIYGVIGLHSRLWDQGDSFPSGHPQRSY